MTVTVLGGTDLEALHAAIVSTSAAAFPGVHFEFYREERRSLPLGNGAQGQSPYAYCLLEMPEMEISDDDPGTGQQAMDAKFEADFIVRADIGSRLAIRKLAGAYSGFLRSVARWPGVLNGEILVTGCYKNDFVPELDQFEVWRVEWTQSIFLGTGMDFYVIPANQTASGNPEIVPGVPVTPIFPSSTFFSYVPLTGTPYQDEYKELPA